ncbi:hypothetical protein [uncultured Aquimarina sp.]|uniref:hypothetical protein n=1 Tax=uncultured Aquimarina sp. TaxID=575652 RepID=UPI00260ABAE7|nr:hypothetical protein [uncultured Aquimarina sp.]
MTTIKDLLQLDQKKIDDPELKKQVKNIIDEHKKAEDKEFFVKELQSSIDTIYELVKASSPEAIDKSNTESPCDDPDEQKPVSKDKKTKGKKTKGKKAAKKEKPKTTTADTLEMSEGLKKCDRELKAFREERRKLLPQKPPPTRYERIKRHILGLGKLIPPKLKDDLETQKQTKKILMKAHRDILNNFKMTSLRSVKRDQKEIKEKFEKIEEKLEQE